MTDTSPRTRWFHRLSLQLALLGFLAVTVAVGATSWVLLDRAERNTLVERQRMQQSEAERTAALLDERVRHLLGTLALIAEQLPTHALDDADANESLLRQRPLLLAAFDSVFVATADGRMRLFHDEKGFRQPGLQISDRQYFKDVLATGQPAVSDPMMGRVSGEPVVALAVPVVRSGRVIGLLAGGVRLRSHSLLAGMSGRTAVGAAGAGQALLFLTDTLGNLVWHPDPNKVGLSVGTEPVLLEPVAHWARAGGRVEPKGRSLNNQQHLLAYAGLPSAGWLLWRLEPRSEVLAPLAEARQQALRAGTLIALCLTGLLLLLLWWLLGPLRQLRSRADRLFEPGLPASQGWPDARGELGELGATLQRVLVEKEAGDLRSTLATQQLHSVLQAAPLAIMLTRNGHFEMLSPEACRIFGRSEADLTGLPASAIYASNQDYEQLGPRVGFAFSRRETFVDEIEFVRGDGSVFWSRLSGRPVDWQDASAGTIWTMADVSVERGERERLQWSAHHDALTGLANRLALTTQMEQVLAGRNAETTASLLLLDLDHFKPINDKHGHAAGDAMLRTVADAISGCVRSADLVARLGGDEFAVLLPQCPVDAAQRVAQSVCTSIGALRLLWQGHALGVGASVGVAVLVGEIGSVTNWLAAADAACYAAKAAGRGTVKSATAPEDRRSLRLVQS